MLTRSVFSPRSISRLRSVAPFLAPASRPNSFGKSPLGIPRIQRDICSASLRGRRRSARELNFRRSSARSMSESGVVSPAIFPVLSENFAEVAFLPAIEDDYGGVIVEVKSPIDPEDFSSSLKASLSLWRHQEKKGVWIKLPIEFSNLVHPVVQEGFRYSHAESIYINNLVSRPIDFAEGFWYHHAESTYIMLVYWIPSTKNTLPINATHRVGVGAFVMNDKREILVVQEKTGRFRGSGVWKLPTGVVDQGEDLSAGAVREVKEETGIDVEFLEVLAFRQSHRTFFEKSDLFFVCLLRPVSFDISIQESEIEAAQWMPIDEYMAQPMMGKNGLMKRISDVGLAKYEKGYAGFTPVGIHSAFSDYKSYLYLNSRDLHVD